MIDYIIDDRQSAFLPENVIHDILIAYDLVKGYARTNISPRCMVQMDLHKAYDSVKWLTLEGIMRKTGFPGEFVEWIMICV